jgi:1,4-dihydroxy-2-naphthoyl-CoA hydrolase
MAIWQIQTTAEALNAHSRTTLIEHLGIEFLEIGADYIRARMPVNHATVTPAGILHGGASAALSETLGSVAANLCIDPAKKSCVGLEINANHIRPVANGYVYGITRPIHLGNATQIWEIRITNEQNKLVCISRLTIAVLKNEGMSRLRRPESHP